MTSSPATTSPPPTSPWRPTLRPEIEKVQGKDGVSGLRQPGTGHFVRIGRVSRALLPHLAGKLSLDALIEKAVETGASRADAEDALRALLLLNFFEGAGEPTLARLRALEVEEPPTVTLPETRFTCHGTGQCCRTYALGPLTEEDVGRLESLDLAKAFPELGTGPYVRRDDQDSIYLERREERCVFLLPDARCGIHAKFGPEMKPDVCRLYPWNAQVTVAGLRISDMSECSTFARSVHAGEPLSSQLERVRPLLPRNPEVYHPLVLLDAEHPCDYGWITALEAHVQPLFAGSRNAPMEALLATGRRAGELAAALAVCPLAPGQPDATVARVLAQPLAPAVASAPTAEGRRALGVVTAALLETISQRNLTSPVVPGLRLVLAEIQTLLETPLPGGPAPGEPTFVADVLRSSLRNAVFAGRLLSEGRLRAGVLRLALVPLLTVAGARLLARERKLPRGGERELSEAHMVASVGLRTPSLQKVLVVHEALALLVLETSASLVRQLSNP